MDSARNRVVKNMRMSLIGPICVQAFLCTMALASPVVSQTWQAPKDKDGLFQWLASDDRIKRPLAANLLWDKFPDERERLHGLLIEMLNSSDKDRRVDAALFLRKHFPKERDELLRRMETDPEVDVRIRLARRFLADYKDDRAIPVLRKIVAEANIQSHEGAESALRAAGGLQEGTGEVIGTQQAMSILSAPSDWFADIAKSPHEYSLRGSVKTLAASFLLRNRTKVPKDQLESGLRSHIAEIESRLSSSKDDKERKYWESHLPSTLELLAKNDMKAIVLEHSNAVRLIKGKHERDWFKSVLEKANGSKK